MSFKKTVISSAAALAVMSATAFATTPTSGVGNYLLYPATYAVGDVWSTKLTVANTNSTTAVVARVVVRASDDSHELFDFPIYLTPGDVWDGVLENHDGNLVVTSTDDSNMIKSGSGFIQASPSNPIYNGEKANIAASKNALTYVEVFQLAKYDAGAIDSSWKPFTDMNKTKFFNHVRNTSDPRDMNTAETVDTTTFSGELIGRQSIIATATAEADRRFMSYNAFAVNHTAGMNDTLTGVIATDTTLDAMTGDRDTALADLRTAMETKEIYALYEGDGTAVSDFRVIFTAPTKKYTLPSEIVNSTDVGWGFEGNSSATAGFLDTTYYYEYNITGRDMSEHVRRCQPIIEDTDYSGVDVNNSDCVPEEAHNEVEVLKYEGLTSDALAKDKYVFPAGGFVTYELNKTTPVVPTEFTSTKVNGMIMVNHLDAQNR